MSRKTTEQHNFVNGWATASRGSSHKHLLPYPVDLGDRELALCGVRSPLGWTEPETDDQWFCHTCLVEFGKLYEDDDKRLTPADRQEYRKISRLLMKVIYGKVD